jgi:hypothetical protein
LWGSISEENTNSRNGNDQNGNKAISPLYEKRLQSLLVEEDSGDDNEETDDDDDDYDILTKLSSYSPEESKGLIGLGNTIDEIKNGDIATLDLSALTLDQRTYIQLCSAGLIDTKQTPYSSIVSSCSSSSDNFTFSSTVQTISEDNNDEDDFETRIQTKTVDSRVMVWCYISLEQPTTYKVCLTPFKCMMWIWYEYEVDEMSQLYHTATACPK